MIDRDILWARAKQGEEYLRILDGSFDADWLELYNAFTTQGRPLTLGLALIHPDHFKHLQPQVMVQGSRQFDLEVAQGNALCYADHLWGGACNVRIKGGACGDHVFPYSLGGPTVATNKMLLCSVHNRMKSADIHVYTWELPEPAWLTHVLDKIRTVMSRSG